MKTDEPNTADAGREPYTQPLLTRHEPLRALTGKSGEKDPSADKDPTEKPPKSDNPDEGPS